LSSAAEEGLRWQPVMCGEFLFLFVRGSSTLEVVECRYRFFQQKKLALSEIKKCFFDCTEKFWLGAFFHFFLAMVFVWIGFSS
jgi:hypothetical protein